MARARGTAPTRMVPINFPLGGISLAAGYENQPPGTCRDALNVVPFEPSSGSARGGQRPGLSRAAGTDTASLTPYPITGLHQATLASTDATGLVDSPFTSQQNQWPAAAYAGSGFNGSSVMAFQPLAEAAFQFHVRVGPAYMTTLEKTTGADDTGGLSQIHGPSIAEPGDGGVFNVVRFTPVGGSTALAVQAYPLAALGTTDINYGLDIKVDLDAMPAGSRFWVSLDVGGAQDTHAFDNAASIALRDRQFVEFYDQATLKKTIDLGAALSGTIRIMFSRCDLGDGIIHHITYVFPYNSSTEQLAPALKDPVTGQPFDFQTALVSGGTSMAFGAEFGSVSGSADMFEYDLWLVQPTVITATPLARQIKLVATSGGNVYVGDINGPLAQVATNQVGTYIATQMDDGQGKVYMVDGVADAICRVLDLSTNTVSDLTADTGKGTAPAGCKLVLIWRDRLILANQNGFEHNVYMSRAGNHNDWLFGQDDVLSAIALNDSTVAGRIGDPVTALIAATDDMMLISTDHQLFAVIGDPGANGTITVVSPSVGVMGPDAWAVDPKGNIYFVGNAGFYAYQPGKGYQTLYSEPQNLAEGKVAQIFAGIDRSNTIVSCCWDRDRFGCWIFMTPMDGEQPTHLWYDERTQSFWRVQFPSSVGPYSQIIYDGDGPTDRQILLGGEDGVIYKIDPLNTTDDGVLIESYVNIGPLKLADPFSASQIVAMECVLGTDTTPALGFEVYVGDDAEDAINSAASFTGTYSVAGRQPRVLTRARGNTAFLKLHNTTLGQSWAFERAALATLPGGPLR